MTSTTNEQPRRPSRERIGADRARVWARELQLGNPYGKSILLAIANYMNEDGSAWPGLVTLARDTDISEETVMKRLRWLEQIGAITIRKRWRDENGRVNFESRGRPTSSEIRFLFDADIDDIEVAAADPSPDKPLRGAARASHADKVGRSRPDGEQDDESSPRPDGAQNPVSSRLAPDQHPPASDVHIDSSELAEDSPPYPPPGGASEFSIPGDLQQAIDAGPWGAITNLPAAVKEWARLPPEQRPRATLACKGYRAYLDHENRGRKPDRQRKPKDFHTWIGNGQWLGYVDTGKASEIAAARVDIREGSAAWQAWDIFYRCCGWSIGIPPIAITGAPGSKIANVPCEMPPVGQGLNPDRATWMRVTEGGGSFAAWMRRLRELPNVRIILDRDPTTGKQALLVPQEWPPAKHVQPVATAPPMAPNQSERQLAHERR